jgi:hypothetical protein
MTADEREWDAGLLVPGRDERKKSAAQLDWTLHRWHVSFRSGAGWYGIGEFVALTAAAAIERAIDIFGPAEDAKAELIPWDAAPLPRPSQKNLT